jgi:TniQ
VLSIRTGTPIDRVHATTLADYESILYEKYNTLGPTSWIMPVGVYHRTRNQFGLQFCPLCLEEDKEPYFRRRWRLAFIVSCERHHTLLHDRCPRCGAAVNFHRSEMGDHRKRFPDSLTLCHFCRFELRIVNSRLITHVERTESTFAAMMLQAMDLGYYQLSESLTTHSLLFFAGLRQLMKIIAMQDHRVDNLRRAISEEFCVEIYSPPASDTRRDVQEMSVVARRQLLGIARCLLEEWPNRFIKFSNEYRIWSAHWLRHVDPPARANTLPAPFWFWSVIHDHLYRPKYQPSNEEVKAAVNYLNRNGVVANKSTLARLLGVSVLRRDIPVVL